MRPVSHGHVEFRMGMLSPASPHESLPPIDIDVRIRQLNAFDRRCVGRPQGWAPGATHGEPTWGADDSAGLGPAQNEASFLKPADHSITHHSRQHRLSADAVSWGRLLLQRPDHGSGSAQRACMTCAARSNSWPRPSFLLLQVLRNITLTLLARCPHLLLAQLLKLCNAHISCCHSS